MRSLAIIALLMVVSVCTLPAKSIEKKGSFGVVINENFVKFNYVITYLGDSYKDNCVAFRLDFEDNKGYNLANEIVKSKTVLKNLSNDSLMGEIEINNDSSVVLLFPMKDDFSLKGNTKLYTEIMGYKLKKKFRI